MFIGNNRHPFPFDVHVGDNRVVVFAIVKVLLVGALVIEVLVVEVLLSEMTG